MAIVQFADVTEHGLWRFGPEDRAEVDSKIPIKVLILGYWDSSEASSKSRFGGRKICLKWTEIKVHRGSPTRKWEADTQEKVKTGDGNGGVVTIDELRMEVGEDRI